MVDSLDPVLVFFRRIWSVTPVALSLKRPAGWDVDVSIVDWTFSLDRGGEEILSSFWAGPFLSTAKDWGVVEEVNEMDPDSWYCLLCFVESTVVACWRPSLTGGAADASNGLTIRSGTRYQYTNLYEVEFRFRCHHQRILHRPPHNRSSNSFE